MIILLWVFGSLLALLWVVLPVICFALDILTEKRPRVQDDFFRLVEERSEQARSEQARRELRQQRRREQPRFTPRWFEDQRWERRRKKQRRSEQAQLKQRRSEPALFEQRRSERARLERQRLERELRSEQARLERLERLRSAHFLLAIAVQLLPPSKRDRYLEEFRAELLNVPRDTRLSHALSLLHGVFVLRLRRGLKKEAADAAARRAKG